MFKFKSEETKQRMYEGNLGKKFSDDHKKKISEALTGRDFSENHKLNLKKALLKRYRLHPDTKETRTKKSNSHKGMKGYWRNKTVPKEIREKIKKTLKEKWKDKIYREKRISKIIGSCKRDNNSFENKIKLLLSENNLPFIYCGDGSIIINGKNPDFIDFKNKRIIEVFNIYHKIMGFGNIENYKNERINAFKGWDVIFITGEELQKAEWKKNCISILNNTNP